MKRQVLNSFALWCYWLYIGYQPCL